MKQRTVEVVRFSPSHGAINIKLGDDTISVRGGVHAGWRTRPLILLVLSGLGGSGRSRMSVGWSVRMAVLDSVGSGSVSMHVHHAHLHGQLTLIHEARIGDVGGGIERLMLGRHHTHTRHTHTWHPGHPGHPSHACHTHPVAVKLVLHQLLGIDGNRCPLLRIAIVAIPASR